MKLGFMGLCLALVLSACAPTLERSTASYQAEAEAVILAIAQIAPQLKYADIFQAYAVDELSERAITISADTTQAASAMGVVGRSEITFTLLESGGVSTVATRVRGNAGAEMDNWTLSTIFSNLDRRFLRL